MANVPRYQRYADELSGLMQRGELPPGSRLPSVREASRRRRISPATVFEAYYLLQARGLIESRPRSGFFVRRAAPLAVPRLAGAPKTTRTVAVSELVFEVLSATVRPGIAPLGSAFPGVELFPLRQLSRALATGMRKLEPAQMLGHLPPGNEQLRRQIALRYALAGTRVAAEEILVTHGAMEALTLSLQVITRPGDTVAVEAPAFYAVLQALERLQLKAVEIPCDPRRGLDVGALGAALRRHDVKVCWFMPSFQNPTGSSLDEAARIELMALLERHDVPLIEDDVYAELHYSARPLPPVKALDRRGLVVHCSSFSKCLAPGYRIGWVAGGRYAREIERAKIMTTLSCAVPSQQAITEYLAHGGYERHLRKLRRTLARQRDLAARLGTRHFPPGTQMSSPAGGYFLWVEFPPGVDTLRLHRDALAHDINIAPGQIFSATQHFNNCVRLNYGHPRDARFEPAMRMIGELARRQLAGT